MGVQFEIILGSAPKYVTDLTNGHNKTLLLSNERALNTPWEKCPQELLVGRLSAQMSHKRLNKIGLYCEN